MNDTTHLPLHRLRKDELVWLATHTCKEHRHSYISHYNCYLKEHEAPVKLGFYDIETSNLDADFGIMLAYCILDEASGIILEGVIQPEDIKRAKAGDEDKRLVKQCIDDMLKFDKLCGYYSSRFDGPFIRTRALACGLDFPVFGTIKHQDLYFTIRNKFKLSRNRLEVACRVLLGKTDKTHIESKYWRGGSRGDKKSLDYILAHCEADVRDLQKLYHRVEKFARKSDVSL